MSDHALRTHIVIAGVMALFGNLLLVLGFLGFYEKGPLLLAWFACAILMVFLLRRFGSWKGRIFSGLNPTEIGLLILIGIFAVMTILQGLVPPVARDALIHHLAVPDLYLREGRIRDIPFLEQAYNPMLVDLLFSIPLVLHRPEGAALLHFAFACLTAHLLYLLGRGLFDRTCGLIGAALFLSLPVVVQLGSEAYVDLGVTYFLCLSWCLLLRHQKSPQSNRWLLASGIFMGVALSTKYNAFLMCPFTALLLGFVLKRQGAKDPVTLKQVGLWLAMAFLADGLWLMRNGFWTGNPIYPFARSWLGRLPSPEALGEIPALSHRFYLYGESVREILALPVRIFFQGQEGDPRLFDGAASPVFVLFLPFVFRKKTRSRSVASSALFLVGFYLLYAICFRVLRMRYLMPIFPLLTLVTVVGWQSLKAPRARRLGFVVLLCFMVFHVSLAGRRLLDTQALEVLSGRINPEQYLTQHLPEFPVQQFANAHLSSSDRIFFLLLGDRGYYLKIPYLYDFHDPGRSWRRWFKSAKDVVALKEAMRREGITHIMVNRPLFNKSLANGLVLDQQGQNLLADLLNSKVELLFENAGIQLLKI